MLSDEQDQLYKEQIIDRRIQGGCDDWKHHIFYKYYLRPKHLQVDDV